MAQKRIAMLMLCHVFPQQINSFINKFNSEHFDFFLHVDKKSDIQSFIQKKDNVFFIPDDERVDVRWGRYSQVEATLNLIDLAQQTKQYDYFWLCSGQDYPIKNTDEIYAFLNETNCNFMSLCPSRNNPLSANLYPVFDKRCDVYYPQWLIGKKFFQRGFKKVYVFLSGGSKNTFRIFRRKPPLDMKVYFGSQWWCLNLDTIKWISEFARENRLFRKFYLHSICPDESFFHTIVMNSPYNTKIQPNLVFVKWEKGCSSPSTLTLMDYDKMIESGKMIARKIDFSREPDLCKKLNGFL